MEAGIARDPTTKPMTEEPRRALRVVEQTLDVFVPEELRLEGADTVKRARLIIAFSLVTAPFGPFFAAAYASFGMRVVGLGILATTIAALLNPLVLRRTGAMWLCEHLPAAYIWTVITFISVYTGGVGTPSLYWLVTLPLFASVFRGGGYARRTMLYEPVSIRTTVEDAIRFTGVSDARTSSSSGSSPRCPPSSPTGIA